MVMVMVMVGMTKRVDNIKTKYMGQCGTADCAHA